MIEAFADFARADLKTVAELETAEFSHVTDPKLRHALAQVFYGVRWIYKVGLSLLAQNEERAAHVRAQIVDYASVCEGLLSHSIEHAIRGEHTLGDAYMWVDPDRRTRPIKWTSSSPEYRITRQSFWWLVRVARDFKIVDARLEQDLDWLRNERNSVHLRRVAAVSQSRFLAQSKHAFDIAMRTVAQTKRWRLTHP